MLKACLILWLGLNVVVVAWLKVEGQLAKHGGHLLTFCIAMGFSSVAVGNPE